MNRMHRLTITTSLVIFTSMMYADNNPYTFFGAGGSSSQGTSAVTVTNAGAVNTATTSNASAAPATTATAASPKIQYAQPASQVGKLGSTQQQPTAFTQTLNANVPQGTLQSPMTSAPASVNKSLQAGLLGTDGGSAPTIDMGTTNNLIQTSNNLLQTIANNTNADQSNTGNLYQYWIKDYSTDSFVPNVTGYSAANGIISAESTQSSDKSHYTLPNLTGNFSASNDQYSPQTAVPYLNQLTDNVTGDPEYSYWGPAVENAMIDLSSSQTKMKDLHEAVNAPFQSLWINTIRTASDPQLLRTLVVEQAVQNALLYQMLQQQQDAMLMQAAELRMLRETLSNTESQVTQEKRVVRALEQARQGK